MSKNELSALVAKYNPHDTKLPSAFRKLYSDNVNTLASRISEFKKRVLVAHPGILQMKSDSKTQRDLRSHSEFKAWNALDQLDKYREWKAAMKVKTPTAWQKTLSEFQPLPKNLQDLKLTEDESAQRIEDLAYAQKVLDNQRVEINGNDMIQKLQVLESKHLVEITAGLLLATGRRTSELIKFGEFKVTGKFEMEMSGQLKSGLNAHAPYVFPVLAPAAFLLLKITQIREYWKASDMTALQINSHIGPSINRYVHKIFDDKTSVNPHMLRAIYAVMADRAYNHKKSEPRFIADILGHSGRENAAFYQRIKLTNYDGQTYHPKQTVAEVKVEKEEVKAAPIKETKKPELIANNTASDQSKRAAIEELEKRGHAITATAIKRIKGGDMTAIKKFLDKNQEYVKWWNAKH